MFFMYTNEAVKVLNNIDKNYSKILISSRDVKSFAYRIFRPFKIDI